MAFHLVEEMLGPLVSVLGAAAPEVAERLPTVTAFWKAQMLLATPRTTGQ